MEKCKWLKKHHTAQDILSSIQYELEDLSKSFYHTGNTIIGEQLETISKEIGSANKMFRDAVNQDISESLKRSQEASTNMLKAALAGCLVGAKKKKGGEKDE